MTPGKKRIAKPFVSEGWSYVYLEPHSPQERAPLNAKLKALGAVEVEDLAAGIVSAKVPADRLDELEAHAIITPMERKSPT